MNGRQNIAFWTNSVSHLHHEIKALNIWLVFIRLIAKDLFFNNRLNRRSTFSTLNEGKALLTVILFIKPFKRGE